jgi:hypothetical protein
MPFKANADRRHHIPKQRRRVTVLHGYGHNCSSWNLIGQLASGDRLGSSV